jgi:hypothetical protein
VPASAVAGVGAAGGASITRFRGHVSLVAAEIMFGITKLGITIHVSCSVCATGRRVAYQEMGQIEEAFILAVHATHTLASSDCPE